MRGKMKKVIQKIAELTTTFMTFFKSSEMSLSSIAVGVEFYSKAQSVSLWADALDFAGDAANYALSLVVLSMSLYWRATAALVKGITMAAFGVFVIAKVVWSYFYGVSPEPMVMGAIGVMALIANVSVALMLYAFRDGDANMRSVWLCSRNDSIANIAVILAAVGVFGTGSVFPDLFVAFVIAYLGVSSGYAVRVEFYSKA